MSDTATLAKNLGELFHHQIYSDVEVTVDGTTFHLHRGILACRSSSLRDLLVTSQSNQVVINEAVASAEAYNFAFEFLYTSNMPVPNRREGDVDLIVGVLRVAEWLDLPDLESVARVQLKTFFTPVNAAQLFARLQKERIQDARTGPLILEDCLTFIVAHYSQVIASQGYAELAHNTESAVCLVQISRAWARQETSNDSHRTATSTEEIAQPWWLADQDAQQPQRRSPFKGISLSGNNQTPANGANAPILWESSSPSASLAQERTPRSRTPRSSDVDDSNEFNFGVRGSLAFSGTQLGRLNTPGNGASAPLLWSSPTRHDAREEVEELRTPGRKKLFPMPDMAQHDGDLHIDIPVGSPSKQSSTETLIAVQTSNDKPEPRKSTKCPLPISPPPASRDHQPKFPTVRQPSQ